MTLLAITAVLGDADRQRFDSAAVERWLRMAKDAVYDAEDALDELATEALQGKLEAESPTSGKWSRISRSVPQPSTVVESNLRKIIEKLEYISHQKDVLGLKDGRFFGKRLATTSLVDESCVYGRDDDKEIMVGGLLSGEDGGGSSGVGLVPIVGMGGVGKTTLAQLVYSDSRVVECFKLRVWVWVSDQFDVTRVTKSILQSVTFQTYSDLHDLNLLQVSLRDELTGKKFLLVLDDVWSKRNGDWDVLWNPLRAGARGSKVIVTTRDADVALSMATVRPHHLECLTYDHCWSLFKSEAFENKSIDEHPNLEAIGREIVNKCDGLPLAAKRLGVILRSRVEESEWKDILGRKLWDLPDNGRDILGTLRLSYDRLPLHLRQCLSYCSMFPKGYEFEEETLVRLWIAEGFVLQLRANKRPEDVGREYLKDLVSSSFFQESTHRRSRFVMHGIMRDFAQYVSGEMCFSLEDKLGVGDRHTIFEKARHSSYIRGKRDEITKFEAFRGVEFLRTFLPLDPHGEIGVSYLSNQVPRDLLSRLKYLRVLSFKGYRITELPDSVGNLKHLRYLDLSHTAISMLPASLCTLRNLETLLLLQCRALTQLPTDMGNLKNLQHLCISRTRLKQMPEHVWKLTNLQTLSNFMVGKSSRSGIQDLRDLSRLSGSLVISGLQNVVSFRDAINASLRDKPELDELVLQWSGIFCDQSDETIEEEIFEMPRHHKNMVKVVPSIREAMEAYEHTIDELEQCNSSIKSGNERVEMDVLEMLQPHRNIKNLVVKDYGGTRFPTWVADPSFSHIVVFKLSNCKKCKHLPPFGQLPALKELTIEGMDGIEVVGPKFYRDDHSSTMPFPSLELLKFENMLEWVEWLSSGIEDGDDFHHLKKLEILDCPELKKLPPHFPALEKMSIARCEELTAFPRLPVLNDNLVLEGGEFPCLLELSIRMCPNLRKLPNLFPSLAILEIDECQELETLPRLPSIHELELRKCDEGVLQNLVALTSLTYLKMCQVSKAECLLEGFFQQLTALEEIQIAYFGDLTTLSNEIGLENLPLLRRFEISGCPHLKRLPQTLHKVPSLKELRVWECPSLVSFPRTGFPLNLTSLLIKECESLESLPEWIMHRTTDATVNNIACPPLEHLAIGNCSSLSSFPSGKLLSTIKDIEIQNCLNLQSLPEMMQYNNSTEFLRIVGLSIRSIPIELAKRVNLSSFMRLKQLVINNCIDLEFLPNNLQNLICLDHLEIANCPLLVSFPEPGLLPTTLRSLKISNCRNLKSLPNQMHRLTCLQELCLDGCPNVVSFPEGGLPTNLIALLVLDCENLRPSYRWGLHRLTSLKDFSFGGCSALVSFPKDWLLPATLTSFQIQRLPNLKALPERLQSLKSLEVLEISECVNLLTLPPEEEPFEMLHNLMF